MLLDEKLQLWVILQTLRSRATALGALDAPGVGKVKNRVRHQGFPKVEHGLKFRRRWRAVVNALAIQPTFLSKCLKNGNDGR